MGIFDRLIKKKKSISNEEIREYWKNYAVDENGDLIDLREVHIEVPAMTPDDSDVCWRCGKKTNNIEKCTIKSTAFGALEEPGNMVLLCPECHKEMPKSVAKEAVLRWVYHNRVGLVRLVEVRMNEESFQEALDVVDTILRCRGLDISYASVMEKLGKSGRTLDRKFIHSYVNTRVDASSLESALKSGLETLADLAEEIDKALDAGIYDEFIKQYTEGEVEIINISDEFDRRVISK